MIPIRDTAPCFSRPIMTWAIMVVCSVIFVSMQFLPDALGYKLVNLYGMVPVRYSNPAWAKDFGLPPDYGFSFISNLFLHNDWLHLIFNMWFLWIFGDARYSCYRCIWRYCRCLSCLFLFIPS